MLRIAPRSISQLSRPFWTARTPDMARMGTTSHPLDPSPGMRSTRQSESPWRNVISLQMLLWFPLQTKSSRKHPKHSMCRLLLLLSKLVEDKQNYTITAQITEQKMLMITTVHHTYLNTRSQLDGVHITLLGTFSSIWMKRWSWFWKTWMPSIFVCARLYKMETIQAGYLEGAQYQEIKVHHVTNKKSGPARLAPQLPYFTWAVNQD